MAVPGRQPVWWPPSRPDFFAREAWCEAGLPCPLWYREYESAGQTARALVGLSTRASWGPRRTSSFHSSLLPEEARDLVKGLVEWPRNLARAGREVTGAGVMTDAAVQGDSSQVWPPIASSSGSHTHSPCKLPFWRVGPSGACAFPEGDREACLPGLLTGPLLPSSVGSEFASGQRVLPEHLMRQHAGGRRC